MVNIGMSEKYLILRHYGDFQGGEAREALLEVSRVLNARQISSLECIIIDCSRVTSVSMENSDKAGYYHFEHTLDRLFEAKALDLREEFLKLDTALIASEIPAVAEKQIERHKRQTTTVRMANLQRFSSVEAALEHYGRRDLDLDSFEYLNLDEFCTQLLS